MGLRARRGGQFADDTPTLASALDTGLSQSRRVRSTTCNYFNCPLNRGRPSETRWFQRYRMPREDKLATENVFVGTAEGVKLIYQPRLRLRPTARYHMLSRRERITHAVPLSVLLVKDTQMIG